METIMKTKEMIKTIKKYKEVYVYVAMIDGYIRIVKSDWIEKTKDYENTDYELSFHGNQCYIDVPIF